MKGKNLIIHIGSSKLKLASLLSLLYLKEENRRERREGNTIRPKQTAHHE